MPALTDAGVETECIDYDGQIHDFILLCAVIPRAMAAMDKLGEAVRT